MRGLSLLLVALGCAAPGRGRSTASASPVPSDVAPARASSAPSPERDAGSSVTFHALPKAAPLEPAPRVEIDKPAFGDALDPRLAAKSEVSIRVLDATPSDVSVIVSLDGARPRPFANDRKLRLEDLYPEDRTLAPGRHVLLAALVDRTGRVLAERVPRGQRPLSLVTFSIGERAPGVAAAEPPSLFCLSPVGTHYVTQGARLPFQVLLFGSDRASLPVRVRGRGVDVTTELDPALAYEVAGLPLGDVSFAVGAAPGPSAECVVTINPDLPAGAKR